MYRTARAKQEEEQTPLQNNNKKVVRNMEEMKVVTKRKSPK